MKIETLRSLALQAGHADMPIPRRSANAAYPGASFSRRMSAIYAPRDAINTLLWRSAETLRDRSRQAVRQNPWAGNAIDRWVSNAIGAGITPKLKHPERSIRKAAHELWSRWVDQADPAGKTDFYGLEELAYRCTVEAGEVLGRLRYRYPADRDRLGLKLSVPLQVQILEPDHLDYQKNFAVVTPDGRALGNVRMGIEFNLLERPVAYHLYKSHPYDYLNTTARYETTRVPVAQVLHVFRQLRGSQWRGEPWLSRVLTRLYELERLEDAALQRSLMAALYSFWLKKPESNGPSPLSAAETDGKTSTIDVQPGEGNVLLPGEDMGFNDPPDDPNYEPLSKDERRGVAAGVGLAKHQLDGDVSDVNFTSARIAILDFRRLCEQIQNNTFSFQFCRPVWKAWIEQAILSGALRDSAGGSLESAYNADPWPFLNVSWSMPKWDWVDPLKDVESEKSQNRAGYKPVSESIKERGGDIEEVFEQIAQDLALADSLGIVLDTDPRKTGPSGKPADPADAKAEEQAPRPQPRRNKK